MQWFRLANIVVMFAFHACIAFAACIAEEISYLRDIKPLLLKHCYKCHSSIASEADIRVDSHASLISTKTSLVKPNHPQSSRLLQVIRGDGDLKMPPNGPGLNDRQIDMLEKWILSGASGPPNGDETRIEHWAFKTPKASVLAHKVSEVNPNIIDANVNNKLEDAGLKPAPQASRERLLRRLYLDLIGVPPSRDEVQNFLQDPSPKAYEQIVDSLLNNPMYAERWARHWMDVWRYSDWDGYGNEIRESQPHIWRWRDWIVESLEQDKPYSQMITEMLAADELPNATDDSIRATGFLVRQWYKFNRNTWIDNTVEHTSKAFMGLTMNCARCHDHMYDPISQKEYYQMRAFFEPIDIRTDKLAESSESKENFLVRVYDKELAPKTYLFARGNEKQPVTEEELHPAVPKVLDLAQPTINSSKLPVEMFFPGSRDYVQNQQRDALKKTLAEAQLKWKDAASNDQLLQLDKEALAYELKAADSALASFEARRLADSHRFPKADSAFKSHDFLALARIAATLERHHAVDQQNFELAQKRSKLNAAEVKLIKAKESDDESAIKTAEKEQMDALKEVEASQKTLSDRLSKLGNDNHDYTPLSPIYPETSTGRRLALAKWLTSKDHPLTARVAVNHVWMRHFGEPLVETVFDFGVNGREPSNQALLDAMAVYLMDADWKLKPLHRLIVTSDVYKRSKHAQQSHSSNLQIDPNNKLLWRYPDRRMEAEVVRDSTLHLAGNLDHSRGGEDLDPNTADTTNRRSIYYRCSKEKRPMYIALFDGPSVVECYRRNESIIPQQALALMNSEFNHRQAKLVAQLIRDRNSGQLEGAEAKQSFVEEAFWTVLGRAPKPDELAASSEFMSQQNERMKSNSPEQIANEDSEASLVLVLLNHHEFVTIP